MRHLGISLGLLLALTACDEFATPAELDRPQILAVQSEPASTTPGGESELTIFIAGSEGPIEADELRWSVVPQVGLPALGELVEEDGKVIYRAPESVESFPTATSIQVEADVDGKTLTAIKAMLIGGPPLVNPSIEAIVVNGDEVDEQAVLPRGEEVEVDIRVDGELSEDAVFAWYARPGEIEQYQSTPTTMLTSDEEAEGWLIAVVRDRGGVGLKAVPMRVE